MLTNATDVKQRLQRLEQERQRLLAIIEDTPDFVAMADLSGQITYVNKRGRRLLGISEGKPPRGVHIRNFHSQETARLVLEEGLTVAAREGVWVGETELPDKDGRRIPTLQVIVAHKNDAGDVEYYSTIRRDITERKRMEERLHHLATHDSLTGVMNRARFQECLGRELARAQQSGTAGAVLYLDLDNFKDINDSIGHHAGDEILQRLARVVREQLRANDKLARLGGDEFAILLPQTPLEDATSIGQRLLTLLGDEAVCFGENAIRVRASMGVATYPDEAATVEDVLIHADLSMYAAKRSGGNQLSVYNVAEEGRLQAQSRLTWEQLCRDAVQNDRFALCWQPLLDLRERDVVAYELLLRMKSADGELIAPGEFLPVCERSDMIHQIDRWVLQQGIDLLAAAPESCAKPIRLHVNLSRKTFSDDLLLPFVRERLDATGVDPSSIVLELTETAAIEDVNRATCFMNALRQMGFRFALDDFGVGFSTFGALRRLPVDYLKIDGSFIRELRQDPINQHLVKAMVEVAQGLGKQTVAEFVPDEPTLQLLADYGVDFGQGYYIGRPEPIDVRSISVN